MAVETRAEHVCFGGRMGFYSHASTQTGTTMNFALYLPPQAEKTAVPALYYLAGLTCTEETFMIKAGAQRLAAELGLALVACDTSPRGLGHAGEDDAYDFGTGAGFYLDATATPWAQGYRMASYINIELPALIEGAFPVVNDRRGIFRHSMGGHGALVSALRHPDHWTSVSAFAPICNPTQVPWGEKAFSRYLGDDREAWKAWDAAELMRRGPRSDTILIDQGTADQFLERELHPEALEAAASVSGQQLTLRRHDGFDHSYWFIQSFVADHLAHHAAALLA